MKHNVINQYNELQKTVAYYISNVSCMSGIRLNQW